MTPSNNRISGLPRGHPAVPVRFLHMTSAQYPFLSPEWIDAAKAIQDEYVGIAPALPPMRVNQIIGDVPFGSGTIDAHIDTSNGRLELNLGHNENSDVTITLDYATARAVMVDQDPSAVLQAFFAGKITVQGDITKLMALQAGLAPAAVGDASESAHALREIGDRVRAITA
jgi:hypothetical protein